MTDNTPESDGSTHNRRGILLAGLGILSWSAISSATAAETPTGTFPVASDDPLLRVRADRIRLVGRSGDPSSPDDGTLWYREDL